MIITNVIDLPWKFSYLNTDVAKLLGKQFNSIVKMFRYKSVLAAYKILSTGLIYYRRDLTMGVTPDESKFLKDGKERFYNLYQEEITEELDQVTPFFVGKLKDGVYNYISIQAEKITVDNWIIIQFPNKSSYNVFKHDLPSLYLGALPNFRIKSFVKNFDFLDWESVNCLLGFGLSSELKPMAETICTMDLRFTEDDYRWMKSQ